MKNKIIGLIIITSIIILNIGIIAFAVGSMNDFKKENLYKNGDFADISQSDWFYDNVINAYEYSLIKGIGDNQFNPNGQITIAEGLALSSRIHVKYYNGIIPESDPNMPWYTSYINYCENNGIISSGEFSASYEEPATRSEITYMLIHTLAQTEFRNENPYNTSIKDMTNKTEYFSSVLTAIQAGIIKGKDSEGNFFPNDKITRAEVAAIINRMIDKNMRTSLVRDVFAQKKQNQACDTTKYYIENTQIPNYGELNNTVSIFSGSNINIKLSMYCYIYDDIQYNKYLSALKENKFIDQGASKTSYWTVTNYSNGTNGIQVYKNNYYHQVWISFYWDSAYNISNSDSSSKKAEIEYNVWDKSENYGENPLVLNYGNYNEIKSKSRVIFYKERETRVKYTYDFLPWDIMNYCTYLDRHGYDMSNIISTDLFINSTFSQRGTEMVKVDFDFIKSEITVEFIKTNAVNY